MKLNMSRFYLLSAVTGGNLLALCGPAYSQATTTSFQNGANGYTGTFDRQISERTAIEKDGSTVASYFVDGYAADGTSFDDQALLRFDGIIGDGPGQVPSGATILSAKVTVTTSLAGNSQSSGPFGIAGLTAPVSSSSSYFDYVSGTDFGGRGPWYQDGSATRAVGGFGFNIPGVADTANVASLVQGWANGSPNYGMVIQAGLSDTVTVNANTADGWSYQTTGYPYSDGRPKLEVEYTTTPVTARTFQRGVNGYSGDTMAFVRSGNNALINDSDPVLFPANPERTEDGSTLDLGFLDGVVFTNLDGTTNSPDDLALVKFGGVFGAGADQVPTNVPVAKAWMVITTGDVSTAAHSSGPWTASQMLRSWDTTTLHSSFGAINGLQIGDGDIGPALDNLEGFIRGAEAWFDVTDYLENVRTGAVDNGIAIQAAGTGDGWQIHANGSATESARPKLVVYSADLGISNPLEGDFNDDGVVDGSDFLTWQHELGAGGLSQADLATWKANFGASAGGPQAAAVPESSAALLSMAALLGLGSAARSRSKKKQR